MLVEQAQKQRNNSTAHLSQHDLPPGRGKIEEELQLFTLPLGPEVLEFLSVLEDMLSLPSFPKTREMVKIPKFLQEKPHLLYAISEKPSSPLLDFLYLTAVFLKSSHSLSIRCYFLPPSLFRTICDPPFPLLSRIHWCFSFNCWNPMLLSVPNEVFLFINKLQSNRGFKNEMKHVLNTESCSEKSLCPNANTNVIHSSWNLKGFCNITYH